MSRFACSLVPYGFAFRRQGPYLTTDTLIHINALHTIEYKYVQVEVWGKACGKFFIINLGLTVDKGFSGTSTLFKELFIVRKFFCFDILCGGYFIVTNYKVVLALRKNDFFVWKTLSIMKSNKI